MDNLAERLRDGGERFARSSWSDQAALMTQAADTIESQSRLLDLAETLAGAVCDSERTIGEAVEAAMTFAAALAEYASAGTVPCGECESALNERNVLWAERDDLQEKLTKALNAGLAADAVSCGECEAKDDLIQRIQADRAEKEMAAIAAKDDAADAMKDADHWQNRALKAEAERDDLRSDVGQIRHVLAGWAGELTDDAVPIMGRDGWLSRVYDRISRAEAERDDLRRQLEHQTKEANEYGRWLDQAQNERDAARIEADDLRRQLDGWDEERLRLVTEKAEALNEADDLRRQLAEADRAHEKLMRDWDTHQAWIKQSAGEFYEQLQQARGSNAALIEVLREALPLAEGLCAGNINGSFVPASSWPLDPIQRILSQPHPGAPLLEELAALRESLSYVGGFACDYQVGDGERCRESTDGITGWCLPCYAKQALDAIRNREGR